MTKRIAGYYSLLRLLGHQYYLPQGIRYRLLRMMANPSKRENRPFEVEFFGAIYPGNLETYIDWNVYFFGGYETGLLYLMRDLIAEEKAPVYVDIGANVGHHSLFMANCARWVHAFEPYPSVRERLEQKIARNQLKNVFVYPVGLGDQEEELEFYAPQSENQGTGSFVSTHASDNNDPLGKLPLVQGDAYFDALNLEKISLIKIDVEGFEGPVLSGLSKTMKRFRPKLVMEFSHTTAAFFQSERALFALLPDDYYIQLIKHKNNCYRLTSFNFEKTRGNLLIQPQV